MTAELLDRTAVEQLAADFLRAVGQHYRRRPSTRATAQEALNAMASVTAVLIYGAREVGDEDGAREFFHLALEQQLAEFREDGFGGGLQP